MQQHAAPIKAQLLATSDPAVFIFDMSVRNSERGALDVPASDLIWLVSMDPI